MPVVPQAQNINTSAESQGLLTSKPSDTSIAMAAAIMDQHGKLDKTGPGTLKLKPQKPPRRGR